MNNITLLDEVVKSAAGRFPGRIGLSGSDGNFTFAEIDRLAEDFAIVLQQNGLVKGDRVAVYLEKNAASVIIFQGILRAGGIYVPIDLQVPIHGVVEILNGCRPKAVFTAARFVDQISEEYSYPTIYLTTPSAGNEQFLWNDVLQQAANKTLRRVLKNENDPAYILFTSGSTGKPKGVCLSHKNALSFSRWAADVTVATEESVIANHAPFSFGISVYDLYVPFLVGARLTILPSRLSLSGRDMAKFLEQEKVTHWYSVPSAILLMMRTPDFIDNVKSTLQALMFAGEPFPVSELNRLREQLPDIRMWNFYGATETNVICYYEITQKIPPDVAAVPLGSASCGDKIWIESTLADSSTGELLVSGPTVMLGYWGESFTTERVYRTNDIVKIDENDIIHFLGRNDTIVKIKGYRVSLVEVEKVIRGHPAIRDVAVALQGESSNGKLIAFATLEEGSIPPTLIQLKALCAEHLPAYKIIHRIKFIEAIPLNVNGKVDRAALINPSKQV